MTTLRELLANPYNEPAKKIKPPGKRSNPEYKMASCYLKKSTHKQLKKILLDQGIEFSEWVELQALQYLENNKEP